MKMRHQRREEREGAAISVNIANRREREDGEMAKING